MSSRTEINILRQLGVSDSDPQNLGINLSKPKYPQYSPVSKRLESFKTWPQYLPVTPDLLSEAGLVYTGEGDSCRCYYCGGGLRYWEEGDNPWEEHAKWFPDCGHVFLVKGRQFIEAIAGVTSTSYDGKSDEDVAKEEEDPLKCVPAQSCLEMGCNRQHVLMAIQRYMKENVAGTNCYSAADLMELVMDIENEDETDQAENSVKSTTDVCHPEDVDSKLSDDTQTDTINQGSTETLSEADKEILQEENDRLKDRQTCKICLDARANIIFLPCGHMVSCPLCAPALVKCPMCRVIIRGTVKAYFANFKDCQAT